MPRSQRVTATVGMCGSKRRSVRTPSHGAMVDELRPAVMNVFRSASRRLFSALLAAAYERHGTCGAAMLGRAVYRAFPPECCVQHACAVRRRTRQHVNAPATESDERGFVPKRVGRREGEAVVAQVKEAAGQSCLSRAMVLCFE